MPVDDSTADSPTTDMDGDTINEARLAAVSGVGPLLRKRLVEAYGDAGSILRAGGQELCRVEGIGPATSRAILAAPGIEETVAMLAEAAKHGIRPVRIGSADYPVSLREIHDPPAVLYCRGTLDPTDRMAVAIVGTRRATRYGLRQAAALATGLARAGVTVVSGLARGIDGAAHKAAMEAGGRTLAVMGGGLLRIYPPEHTRLADEVAEQGALLAEPPPGMPPMSGSFPQRNRIISGLSLGVVVVEAAERSGALITARHAAEQGRDAYAVPGPVDSAQSLGCCRLLQEGAKLVVSVEDILEELELSKAWLAEAEAPIPQAEPPLAMSDDERTIWQTLTAEPATIDTIVQTTGLPVARVLASLSRLEASGGVRRVSGSLVARAV